MMCDEIICRRAFYDFRQLGMCKSNTIPALPLPLLSCKVLCDHKGLPCN